MYWLCCNREKQAVRLLIRSNKTNMAATPLGFDSIEAEVQAHMALHPDDNIFQLRSVIAMRAMINEAPPTAVKRTENVGEDS